MCIMKSDGPISTRKTSATRINLMHTNLGGKSRKF